MAKTAPAGRRTARRARWLLAGVGGLLALLGAATLWPSLQSPAELGLSRELFEQETGLRLLRIAVTADGGLIDVRYQALDPDKAAAIHDPETPPTIIDEKTDLIVDRPWMAHAHRRQMRMAGTYYTLLLNPGRTITPGSTVTFQIGAARLPQILVE